MTYRHGLCRQAPDRVKRITTESDVGALGTDAAGLVTSLVFQLVGVAKIFTSTTDARAQPLSSEARFRKAAVSDQYGVHELISCPEEADVIFLFEPDLYQIFLDRVREHPLWRAYPHKVLCYCESDDQIPMVPGIYPSLNARWHHPGTTCGGMYISVYQDNRFIERDVTISLPPYLYSFMGSALNGPVRRRVMELPREQAFIEDTTELAWRVIHGPASETERSAFACRYAEVLRLSRFVLCPRGWGTSSVRIFETLRSGRVPVIISDDWLPPRGLNWGEFSVRVPEASVAQIPTILRRIDADWRVMADKAFAVHEKWFSVSSIFQRICDWGLELVPNTTAQRRALARQAVRQALSPKYCRSFIRSRFRLLRGRLGIGGR